MGRKYIWILSLLIILSGCGRKVKLPTNPNEPGGGTLDTTYLPVGQAWEEANGLAFDHPQDVHLGFDGHIYIADTGNDRIVKLDLSGEFIEQYDGIENPTSVSQDQLFRLLATGDNVIYKKGNQDEDLISIYVAPDFYDTVPIVIMDTVVSDTDTVIVPIDTFLVDTSATTYEGIAANPLPLSGYAEYYACDFTRSEITRFLFYEPSTARNLGPAVPKGWQLGQTYYPLGIFTYLTPTGFHLVFCQFLYYYSVQLLDGRDFSPVIPYTARPDIYGQDTFGQAEDVTVDEYGNIYVVDSEKDSVLKFSKNGARILSFGAGGSGGKEFENPEGIAYHNRMVYVADTGNNRILRFAPSTDIPK
jgi:hypothetical protein